MKLQNYIKNLQKALDKYGNLEVIYSSDDEGNAFGRVYFSPTPAEILKESLDQTHLTSEDLEMDMKKANAIIIN